MLWYACFMPTITRRDYLIAAVVGILTAAFAIPTLINIGLARPSVIIGIFAAIPILWVAGVWLGGFLGQWFSFFIQFGKFATIGFLSAAIDFGVLNILSYASGLTAGFLVGWINAPGFALAVVNGYLWNRLWVFRQQPGEGLFRDFPKFLAVTVSGLFLNSGIVVFATTYVPPQFGAGPEAWLNIAKVAANAVILIWNFVGYKIFVFK